MVDAIRMLLTAIPGLLLVAGLWLFIHKRTSVDWEKLSAAYASPWRKPLASKIGHLILYSEGRPAHELNGAIRIGRYTDGIGIKPFRLFHPFYKPIWVPFDEVTGWNQSWYLNAASRELTFQRTPHMRLIMPADQVEWLLQAAAGRAELHDAHPPHGTRPWRTFYLSLVFFVATVTALVAIAFKQLL